jgi:hypothetical protein
LKEFLENTKEAILTHSKKTFKLKFVATKLRSELPKAASFVG